MRPDGRRRETTGDGQRETGQTQRRSNGRQGFYGQRKNSTFPSQLWPSPVGFALCLACLPLAVSRCLPSSPVSRRLPWPPPFRTPVPLPSSRIVGALSASPRPSSSPQSASLGTWVLLRVFLLGHFSPASFLGSWCCRTALCPSSGLHVGVHAGRGDLVWVLYTARACVRAVSSFVLWTCGNTKQIRSLPFHRRRGGG